MKQKNWLLYVSLLVGYVAFTYLINNYVLTDTLFYNSYGSQLTAERISQILSYESRFESLTYIIVSVSFTIKVLMITFILYTGTILSGLKVDITSLFRIVLQAEFVFLFAFFVKYYWIYVFMSDVSLEKISFFQPLSIINFFSIGEVPKWFVYPLQLVNLFEIAYLLVMADLLKKIIKRSFWKSFEFVLGTYGVGLLIWAVLVVFFTLNFS